MKQDYFLDFREDLHGNKDIFELPDLPYDEFQLMLDRAKNASATNLVLRNSRGGFLIRKLIVSPRLAAALVFTIFALTLASYVGMGLNSPKNENISVQRIDKNTRIPMDNVVRVSADDI